MEGLFTRSPNPAGPGREPRPAAPAGGGGTPRRDKCRSPGGFGPARPNPVPPASPPIGRGWPSCPSTPTCPSGLPAPRSSTSSVACAAPGRHGRRGVGHGQPGRPSPVVRPSPGAHQPGGPVGPVHDLRLWRWVSACPSWCWPERHRPETCSPWLSWPAPPAQSGCAAIDQRAGRADRASTQGRRPQARAIGWSRAVVPSTICGHDSTTWRSRDALASSGAPATIGPMGVRLM